jgi:hypothetical protein
MTMMPPPPIGSGKLKASDYDLLIRHFRAYRYLARTIVNSVSLGGYVPAGDAVDLMRAFARAQARVRLGRIRLLLIS